MGHLDLDVTPIRIDPSDFHGSLRLGDDDNDTNCWTAPNGSRFMIRGKNYLKDNSKVSWMYKSFDYLWASSWGHDLGGICLSKKKW